LLHNINSGLVFSGALEGLSSPLGATHSFQIPAVCLKDPQARQKKMKKVPNLKFQMLKVELITREKNQLEQKTFQHSSFKCITSCRHEWKIMPV
jgi:hypothetical protein